MFIFQALATILRTLKDFVLYILFGFLELILLFIQFMTKFVEFLGDAICFIIESDKTFLINNWRYIFTFCTIGFHHEFLIINEEVLVAFCFFSAVLFLKSNLGESVTESLTERSDGIRKELSAFLLLKQENLKELYASEQSFLSTTENLDILKRYCQEHFVHLNENQQKALVGLVAQNLHSKLEALQIVKKGLQPTLHKQINNSFREAVLEAFTKTKGNTAQSIADCLLKLKKLKKKKKA
jgi:hypothetical protein